jgi:hypothetical protein
MTPHAHTKSAILGALALLALAEPAAAQGSAYISYEPANPAPTDTVTFHVLRLSRAFDPTVAPKLYISYPAEAATPSVQWTIPAGQYDPASPHTFTAVAERLSLVGTYLVRYYDAATPDLTKPPDGWAGVEVRYREPERVTVIEYYNAARDHYFMTADPREIAALDTGQTPGWARTGESFGAWRAGTGPNGTGVPICRMYGRPEFGIDSHFYAAPGECADVQRQWPAQWTLETVDAFELVYLYACSDVADAVPLYRFYDNRPDANHRYTRSSAIGARMKADGWIAEGIGPTAVAGCAFAP